MSDCWDSQRFQTTTEITDKDFNKLTTTNMNNSVSLSNDHNPNQDGFNPELFENLDVFDDECDDDAPNDMPDEEDVEDYVVGDAADRTENRHQTAVIIVGIVIMIAFVVAVSYICYQFYYV